MPRRDWSRITHIWERRFKKTEYETGELPLAEFICGSGVQLIVLYPWPNDLRMPLGTRKPTGRKTDAFVKYSTDLRCVVDAGTCIGARMLSRTSASSNSYITKSGTTLIGTNATGAKRIGGPSRSLLTSTRTNAHQSDHSVTGVTYKHPLCRIAAPLEGGSGCSAALAKITGDERSCSLCGRMAGGGKTRGRGLDSAHAATAVRRPLPKRPRPPGPAAET